MTLRGASQATVRAAIREADPLPGTSGFAGTVDGCLVRDVLGREPLFVDGDDLSTWAFEPGALADPQSVPAGHRAVDGTLERQWSLPAPDPRPDPEAAIDELGEAIQSVTGSIGTDDLAIAFSGGVDSALLATLLEGPLYAVGFPESHDLEAARTAADAMGRECRTVELSLEDVEAAVPRVARAIDRTNAMDVTIALSLHLVAQAVADDGHERLVVGQGADELFGGYEKVEQLDHRVAAETVRGAVRESLETLPAQLERDSLAIRAAGVDPVAPLLHDDVVRVALRLPTACLVSDGVRKRALRAVAAEHLPADVAARDKKAIQYGTLVARELDRLARQAGFKRRMENHVSRYVASRLD